MKKLITKKIMAIKAALIIMLFMGANLHSYSFTLIEGPNICHPLIWLPADTAADSASIQVEIDYQYRGSCGVSGSYPSIYPYLTDGTQFQSLGSLTFDGNTYYAWRYIGAYPLGPDGTITDLFLTATDYAIGGAPQVYRGGTPLKSCDPCNYCPSPFYMSWVYTYLPAYILGETIFPWADYDGPYGGLGSMEQAVLATALNWEIDNNNPTVSDYQVMLNPANIGSSSAPSSFCLDSSGLSSCSCRNMVFNQLQNVLDSLSLIGLNYSWFEDYRNCDDTLNDYHCICLGDYKISLVLDTMAGDSGYELLALPLNANIPAFTGQIIFSGSSYYDATAYSYHYGTPDMGGLEYNGSGGFNDINGYYNNAYDSTFGPCNVCASIMGNAVINTVQDGDLTYQFNNAGSIMPNFINWFVDGSTSPVEQTLGNGTFTYTFNGTQLGTHTVCMQCAYIFNDTGGTNICCYDQTCTTIFIDSCDYWKATDSIGYVLDSSNFETVIFTYYGNMSPIPTVIWNFGDGTIGINDGDTISHTYDSIDTFHVCVIVIWSLRGDSLFNPDSIAVCCCVDTICFNVIVSPSEDRMFSILRAPSTSGPGSTSFLAVPSASVASYQQVTWNIAGNAPVNTGASPYYVFGGVLTGTQQICASLDYYVQFATGPAQLCHSKACASFNFGGDVTTGLVKFYPNPATDQLTVEVTATANDNAEIDIIDYLGRPVMIRSFTALNAGTNQLFLDMHDIHTGVYEMKVKVGSQTTSVKMEKQ